MQIFTNFCRLGLVAVAISRGIDAQAGADALKWVVGLCLVGRMRD